MRYELRRTKFELGETMVDSDGDVWEVIETEPHVLLCTVGGCQHPKEKIQGCRETVPHVRSFYGPLETLD